jgi:septal ring factor EnvC (AmiA/AmiB activator)
LHESVKFGRVLEQGSVVGFLEVIESDLAKNLAQIEQEEAAAQTQYDKITQENKVTTATKQQDVKYKTKEFTSLDKEIAELTADRDSANTELDAVLEYDTKIKAQCIATPGCGVIRNNANKSVVLTA